MPKKIEIKVTNRMIYAASLVLGILLVSAFACSAAYSQIPNPGHGADTVEVTVDDFVNPPAKIEKTLQQAIDQDLIKKASCVVRSHIYAGHESEVDIMCPLGEIATGGGAVSREVDEEDHPYGSFPITSAGGIVADGGKPIGWHCTNHDTWGGGASLVACLVVCCKP